MSNILIVDDEVRLLRILRLGLPPYGFTVLTATNGQEALKVLFDKHIDIVITDIRMPVMDGLELIFEIERLGLKVPLIVTTAHADVDGAVKTFKHGASDYIRKPFSVEELVHVIKTVLQKNVPTSQPANLDLQSNLNTIEKETIQKALIAAHGVKSTAARLLKISERNLWYKLKKYGL